MVDESHIKGNEEKSDFGKLPFLHIYSQPCPHFLARIVGNRKALEMLLKTIEAALYANDSTLSEVDDSTLSEVCGEEVYATDGEGYSVRVKVFPDDPRKQPMVYNIWESYLPHYCDVDDKKG